MRATIYGYFPGLLQLAIDKDSVKDCETMCDDLKGKPLAVEIKQYREGRTLTANAYFWKLTHDLSEKLHIDPIEIYREYIRQLGICKMIEINDAAVDTFMHSWSLHGVGWLCEVLDESDHDGFKIIRAFYGSSVFNKAQMARLIDLVVFDCQEQGIETKTPEEIAKLKSLWGET